MVMLERFILRVKNYGRILPVLEKLPPGDNYIYLEGGFSYIRWFYTPGADYWICLQDVPRPRAWIRKKQCSRPGQAWIVNVIWKMPATIP
ncbi:MAG: hypothetical protein LUQ35_00605 [Methanoregula sp.]|jgi:hypothetical protein|nr:hypothetical protein [Methanoregula sp.]